jgi:hypothetical protein
MGVATVRSDRPKPRMLALLQRLRLPGALLLAAACSEAPPSAPIEWEAAILTPDVFEGVEVLIRSRAFAHDPTTRVYAGDSLLAVRVVDSITVAVVPPSHPGDTESPPLTIRTSDNGRMFLGSVRLYGWRGVDEGPIAAGYPLIEPAPAPSAIVLGDSSLIRYHFGSRITEPLRLPVHWNAYQRYGLGPGPGGSPGIVVVSENVDWGVGRTIRYRVAPSPALIDTLPFLSASSLARLADGTLLGGLGNQYCLFVSLPGTSRFFCHRQPWEVRSWRMSPDGALAVPWHGISAGGVPVFHGIGPGTDSGLVYVVPGNPGVDYAGGGAAFSTEGDTLYVVAAEYRSWWPAGRASTLFVVASSSGNVLDSTTLGVSELGYPVSADLAVDRVAPYLYVIGLKDGKWVVEVLDRGTLARVVTLQMGDLPQPFAEHEPQLAVDAVGRMLYVIFSYVPYRTWAWPLGPQPVARFALPPAPR